MKMYRNNEIFKDITIYFFTLPLLLLLFEFDKKKNGSSNISTINIVFLG